MLSGCALLPPLAIRTDSFVLILQNTHHNIGGRVGADIHLCGEQVSCRQFETHVLSVSGLKATFVCSCV